jgi:hypothetical protein
MTMSEQLSSLPEYDDNPFIAKLPPILSPKEAWKALNDPPRFDAGERQLPAHIRLHCVRRLGNYFYPLQRHLDLQAEFDLMLRSGYLSRNPLTTDYVSRLRLGHERLVSRDFTISRGDVRSSADSFSLIGCSGVGKSKTIERILELYPKVIGHDEPFRVDQVVWCKLDCPYMGSPKQLCRSFFADIDTKLGSTYSRTYGGRDKTVDQLMLFMSQIANVHGLGVLILDEIQHLVEAKGAAGRELMNFLVTLVNTIGVPVIFIGTLAATSLLQESFRQARRADGSGSAVWHQLPRGSTWNSFVQDLWKYQWTRDTTPLTPEIMDVLYDESQGIVDIVIKLFMMCQYRAIRLGDSLGKPEELTVKLIRQVASEKFKIIKPMIQALRANDIQALAKYDDIRPLHDAAAQAFRDERQIISGVAVQAEAAVKPVGKDSTFGAVLEGLKHVGLADDVAEIMISEAMKEKPSANPLEIMAIIGSRIADPAPTEAKRAAPKPSLKLVEPVGLVATVAAGNDAGKSAYQSLKDAGFIGEPLKDLAALIHRGGKMMQRV